MNNNFRARLARVLCVLSAATGLSSGAAFAATVPDAPTIVSAIAEINSVTISFTPPANNGGLSINSYFASCGNQTVGGGSSPLTVSGLPAGIAVTCFVQAANSMGNSAAGYAPTVTPLSPNATLYFHSQPGDYIGNAKTQTIAPADNYAVMLTSTPKRIALRFSHFDSPGPKGTWWDLSLVGPDGADLAVGKYNRTYQSASLSPGVAGLDFSGDGRGCSPAGRFEIFALSRGVSGEISELAVDFEIFCYGYYTPGLYGKVRYNSSITIDTVLRHINPLTWPSVTGAQPGTLVTSSPAAISDIDVPLPITITGGEYSLNNGPFTAASGTVTNGQGIRARLTSAATPNTLSTATLDIGGTEAVFKVGTAPGTNPQPNGAPLFVLVIPPVVLPGTTAWNIFTPATLSTVTLNTNAGSNASYNLTASQPSPSGSGTSNYYANFAGVNYTALAVGTFDNVPASVSATSPGFSLSGPTDCTYVYETKTRLVVHEVEYQAGVMTKLAMDFVQFCGPNSYRSGSPIYGYVRINSNRAVDYAFTYPVAFKFPMVTGAAQGAVITSATGTIAGINVPIPISVIGGEYSIDGAPFTAVAGTISVDQTVRVRLTSAATPNTVATATLTLGTLEIPFKVGTALGANPQANNGAMVALTAYTYATTATPVQTRLISPAGGATLRLAKDPYVSGYFGPVSVTTEDPLYNTYGNSWNAYIAGPNNTGLALGTYVDAMSSTSAGMPRFQISGTYDCSYSYTSKTKFTVREIEYLPDGTPTKLAVDFVMHCSNDSGYSSNISDVIGFIRVNSTVPIDYLITLPAPFSFPNVTGAVPGSPVTSTDATILGITTPVPISIAVGQYSIDGGPFVSAAGNISAGQAVKVRLTASALSNATAVATLTVGDRTATFSVGTTAGATPQPNGAPLIVLLTANGATSLKPPYVISAATFATIAATTSQYSTLYGGIQAVQSGATWQLYANGPGKTALAPGNYSAATTDSSSATVPYFSITTNSSGNIVIPACSNYYNYSSLTDFTVHEVEYSVTGLMLKLAMDFHQQCTGDVAGSVVHGYIRFNSNVAVDYSLRKPVTMTFPMVTGATPGAMVESAEITVRGINVVVPVTMTGGAYSIDGGPYTSVAGTLSEGQKLKLRVTAPAANNALATAHVVVGERSADFNVGTTPGANPPANGGPLLYLISLGVEYVGSGQTFFHSPAAGSTFSTSRQGGTAMVSAGIPAPPGYGYGDVWNFAFAAADGGLLAPGTYSLVARTPALPSTAGLSVTHNGYQYCTTITGQFTVHEITYGATGIDKLAIDFVHYCSGYSGPLYGYLRINSSVPVVAVADDSPSPFSFNAQTGVARSTVLTSNSLTPTGYTVPVAISITGGEYSIDNGAFTSAPGTITPGQSVRVRVLSPAQYGNSSSATLTIGGVSGMFNVYTENLDSYPDWFTFGFLANVPLNQWTYSPIVTPTGFNAALTVTINGGEFSVGGRPFTSAPSGIQPGETIQVRLMSSTAYYDYRVSLLTIGNTTVQFSIQTPGQVDVAVAVNGQGSVTSAPAGINCPSTCTTSFQYGTSVTLTANPAAGMQFAGWSGAGCSGTGTCTVIANAAQAITANFSGAPSVAPSITAAVAGNGSATLSFVLAAAPGALPVTSFTATCGGVSKTSASSPITLTGLTNGVTYPCTVTAANSAGASPASSAVNVTPSAAVAVELVAVQSRKTHGSAGVFDLPVKTAPAITDAITVEPRIAVALGHTVVFQFNTDVTSGTCTAIDGSGNAIVPASVSFNGNEVTVQFAAIADKTRITAALSGVNGTLSASASIGFLAGDVNGSYAVGDIDMNAVKSHAGQTVNADNYLFNIVVSGTITARDIGVVKARKGNTLP
ncbi:MAG: hypothetical protein ABI905_14010 [Betaproteobacteria bacterium]